MNYIDPYIWLREVCPDLYPLIIEYEKVEDWCLDPKDEKVDQALVNFRKLLYEPPRLQDGLAAFIFVLAHLHTSLCIQYIELATESMEKFGDTLLKACEDCIVNGMVVPEAKVIQDRLIRLSVTAYFSVMFSKQTRISVMKHMRFKETG